MKIKEGDRIGERVVQAKCGPSTPGHWVCRTHGPQQNNMMAASHREHGLAWYCAEHDALEVP